MLCGILYVLYTGIQWAYLLKGLGFGSGMTCWRRLRDCNEAGVRRRLHEVLLVELNAASRLDWPRCVVDSSHVRAFHGPRNVCSGLIAFAIHLVRFARIFEPVVSGGRYRPHHGVDSQLQLSAVASGGHRGRGPCGPGLLRAAAPTPAVCRPVRRVGRPRVGSELTAGHFSQTICDKTLLKRHNLRLIVGV